MKNIKSKQKAFTLMELIVVIVILSIIAGFAVTSYQKSILKSIEQSAKMNLMTLEAALVIYNAQAGEYWSVGCDFGVSDVDTINAGLDIKMLEGKLTYGYLVDDDNPANYRISATYGAPGDPRYFRLSIGSGETAAFCCGFGGTCPTVTAPCITVLDCV